MCIVDGDQDDMMNKGRAPGVGRSVVRDWVALLRPSLSEVNYEIQTLSDFATLTVVESSSLVFVVVR